MANLLCCPDCSLNKDKIEPLLKAVSSDHAFCPVCDFRISRADIQDKVRRKE
jgi:rubredoxin